jgi:DNA replication factor GINS
MYNELYDAWKKELLNTELEELATDFYLKLAEYSRRFREEGRMLDKKTLRSKLLEKEKQNAKRMIRELVQVRYRKLLAHLAKGEAVATGVLNLEEERIYASTSSFAAAFKSLIKNVLQGNAPKIDLKQEHKGAVLRFLKEVPAVIGKDMKTYGPFKVEDIASVPFENAKILVKQGMAEEVDAD